MTAVAGRSLLKVNWFLGAAGGWLIFLDSTIQDGGSLWERESREEWEN